MYLNYETGHCMPGLSNMFLRNLFSELLQDNCINETGCLIVETACFICLLRATIRI